MKGTKIGRRSFLRNVAAASLAGGAVTLLPRSTASSSLPPQTNTNSPIQVTPVLPTIGLNTVYVNGVVITMDRTARNVQAVAVDGDRILAAGSNDEIRKLANSKTRVVDLGNKVILPGFISAHDHFDMAAAIHYTVDLNSPPVGAINSIDDLIQALKKKAQETPRGQWVMGFGYDQTLLREKRQPTRYDLDKASTDHPIFIYHTSGHLSVANSLALKMAGVTKDTPQPKGGAIERNPETGEPTGLLEERGDIVSRLIPPLSLDQYMEGLKWAGQDYAKAGVTTSVIAGSTRDSLIRLQEARRKGLLSIRFTVMGDRGNNGPEGTGVLTGFGDEWMKIGPIGEAVHDGSIQGYTGYLSKPYYVPYHGDPNYRGFPHESKEELIEIVKKENREGYQIAIHANGDEAIQDLIDAYREAGKDFPRSDTRFRIEHCQMVREDQLDQIKELGITPSFFVSHTYFWGDQHRDIFIGPERAARISPLRSAINRGIRFSIHLDTPVTPMRPLQAVWSGVNRVTRSGKVLGPEQRVTPLEALRAVTIDAAWQNFEGDIKGSIEPGKLADFVVLEKNPLTIDPMKIRDIPVVETIVGGKTIFKKA